MKNWLVYVFNFTLYAKFRKVEGLQIFLLIKNRLKDKSLGSFKPDRLVSCCSCVQKGIAEWACKKCPQTEFQLLLSIWKDLV